MTDRDPAAKWWRIIALLSSSLLVLTLAMCAFAPRADAATTGVDCLKPPVAHHKPRPRGALPVPLASPVAPVCMTLPPPEEPLEPIVTRPLVKYVTDTVYVPEPCTAPPTHWWTDWFGIGGDTPPAVGGGYSGGGHVAAPEIDPSSATSALTLLSGALVMLRGRRKC